jgi:hypothetical protein
VIKFYKVVWNNHSERDAAWEREDYLRGDYPAFYEKWQVIQSRDEIPIRGECRYRTYGVMYQVDFYPGAYPGSIVKIEGHKSRWRGLQAVKTNLVRILGKLNSVIDLELLNCIRLGLESYLNLLSIYKESLGVPLVHRIIQSIQCKGKLQLDVGLLLDHEGLN